MLTAIQAQRLTSAATLIRDAQNLQNEISGVENKIRQAAGLNKYTIVYNAQIVGNPIGDPVRDSNLTQQQIVFRDTLTDASYIVTIDPDTHYWKISWTSVGPERLVTVYSIRTTITPGSASIDTIAAVTSYFQSQIPPVNSSITVYSGNGGNINEADFGASARTFYEYLVVATQQNRSTSYASGIKTAVIGAGHGYNSGNVAVYKMTV